MLATCRRLALVMSLFGCAQPAAQGTTQPSRTDRTIITQEQLRAHPYPSAYEAVEALRSNWFLSKGPDSFQRPTTVRVYLDNQSMGTIEALKSIPVGGVAYMRYYDGISASSRWGLDHGAGVIYVSTQPLTSQRP
jgi:hypothetical protein